MWQMEEMKPRMVLEDAPEAGPEDAQSLASVWTGSWMTGWHSGKRTAR